MLLAELSRALRTAIYSCVIVVTLLALPHVAPAAALQASDWMRKDEGWFFYEPEPEPELEPEPEQPPITAPLAPVTPPEQKETKVIPPFSNTWYREHFQEIQDRAIDDPSEDNVSAYLYAHRIMMDKSQNFAHQVALVSQTDPMLDETTRFPFASAMRSSFIRMADEAQKDALRDLAGRMGVWYFFRTDCQYCVMQHNAVEHLAKEYGFPLMEISVDGGLPEWPAGNVRVDSGQFQRLGLQIVPAVVLAVPPDTFLVISQGLLSQSAMDERVLLVAEKNGLITEERLRRMHPADRGVLTPLDIQHLPVPDDPVEMVTEVRKRLKERYW